MSKFCTAFTIFFLVFSIAACQNRSPEPSPILDDQTCRPPCWNSIMPGKTTASEAENILKQSSDIIPETITAGVLPGGLKGIFWDFKNNSSGTIHLKDNFVFMIYFTSFEKQKSIGINFINTIEKYGEPESVLTNTSLCPGDLICIELIAFYPHSGIIFNYGGTVMLDENYEEELKPESPIASLWYISPESYRELIYELDYFGIKDWTENDIKNNIHLWQGYGNIRERYPSASMLK